MNWSRPWEAKETVRKRERYYIKEGNESSRILPVLTAQAAVATAGAAAGAAVVVVVGLGLRFRHDKSVLRIDLPPPKAR